MALGMILWEEADAAVCSFARVFIVPTVAYRHGTIDHRDFCRAKNHRTNDDSVSILSSGTIVYAMTPRRITEKSGERAHRHHNHPGYTTRATRNRHHRCSHQVTSSTRSFPENGKPVLFRLQCTVTALGISVRYRTHTECPVKSWIPSR